MEAKTEGKRSRANLGIYEQRAASEAHLSQHGYAPPFEDKGSQSVLTAAAGAVSPTSCPSTPKKQRQPEEFDREDRSPDGLVAYIRRMLQRQTPEQRYWKVYNQKPPLETSGSMHPKFDPSPPESWGDDIMKGELTERLYQDITTSKTSIGYYLEWKAWKRGCMARDARKTDERAKAAWMKENCQVDTQARGASYIGSTVVFIADEESPSCSGENNQGDAGEWAKCSQIGEVVDNPYTELTVGNKRCRNNDAHMADALGLVGAHRWSTKGAVAQSIIP